MATAPKITITFDLDRLTAQFQSNGDLTTGEYTSAASLSLKAALATANDCGCAGCRLASPRLRLALELVNGCEPAPAPSMSATVGSC